MKLLREMFRSFTLLTVVFFGACGTSDKANLTEQLAETRLKLSRLEARSSTTDVNALALIEKTNKRLKQVEDLIIESEYEQASDLLRLIDSSLTRFMEEGRTDDLGNPTRRIALMGRVTYEVVGEEDSWSPLKEEVAPKAITGLRTAIRSGVFVAFPNGPGVTLGSEAELLVKRNARRRYMMDLNRGTAQLVLEGGEPMQLRLGNILLDIQGPGVIEAANQVLTGNRQVSVYKGRVTWDGPVERHDFSDLEGMRWTGDEMTRTNLPGAPRPQSPDEDGMVYTNNQETTSVLFQWYSSGSRSTSQLQVSAQPYYFTRIFDNAVIPDEQVKVVLKPGVYYWRARSMGKNRIPGPFSKSRKLIVSKETGTTQTTATKKEKPKAKGPEISDVSFEIFKPTVLVSGQTVAGSRVRVNGETAVVMDDGRFRSVINMAEAGQQMLRIEAMDPVTGNTTTWEKEIIIP
ncbi:MAG: hypothetical protein QNK37_20135 [Acidobacteriota bacterium]|nr:hypothetical protein [Acidobacteriota bacterium]